jgi:ABC-type oligopeptide transport system substrate-binding subunit
MKKMKNAIKMFSMLMFVVFLTQACVSKKKYESQEALAKRHLNQKLECQDKLDEAKNQIA